MKRLLVVAGAILCGVSFVLVALTHGNLRLELVLLSGGATAGFVGMAL